VTTANKLEGLRGSVRQTYEVGDCISSPLGQGQIVETYVTEKSEGQMRCTVKIDRPSCKLDNDTVEVDVEHLSHLTRAPGFQRRPSTKTAHFFGEGCYWSACKRESRTSDGDIIEQTDFMVCTNCGKALKEQRVVS